MNALGIIVAAGIGLLLFSAVIDRVLVPWWARRIVRKILKNQGGQDPHALENSKYGTILTDEDGLTIKHEKGDDSALRWTEVEAVHAFKKDLFTTDLICLAFERSGEEEYYQIHEEMAGYHDLLEALPTRLPGFNLEWFSAVAFPAFKTNQQVIWRRSPS
jgi:hypothetical protein